MKRKCYPKLEVALGILVALRKSTKRFKIFSVLVFHKLRKNMYQTPDNVFSKSGDQKWTQICTHCVVMLQQFSCQVLGCNELLHPGVRERNVHWVTRCRSGETRVHHKSQFQEQRLFFFYNFLQNKANISIHHLREHQKLFRCP